MAWSRMEKTAWGFVREIHVDSGQLWAYLGLDYDIYGGGCRLDTDDCWRKWARKMQE